MTAPPVIASHAVVSPEGPAKNPSGQSGSRGDWGTALRQAAPLIGIGTTLAATVLLALGVGYWLDQRLKTGPWLLLAGGMFGLFAALYQFFRTVAGLKK